MLKRVTILLVFITIFTIAILSLNGYQHIANGKDNTLDNVGNESVVVNDSKGENPIDKAFEKDFEMASATSELNYVSDLYMKAWKNEWDNIITKTSELYEYESDKKAIYDYKKKFEEFVQQAFDVELLNWTDTSIAPGKNRYWGTGAMSSGTMIKADLYKGRVLYLIEKYNARSENKYEFLYNKKGAELEKIRNEENGKIKSASIVNKDIDKIFFDIKKVSLTEYNGNIKAEEGYDFLDIELLIKNNGKYNQQITSIMIFKLFDEKGNSYNIALPEKKGVNGLLAPKNKIDGKITFKVREGEKKFRLEIKPWVTKSIKKYVDINIE